MDGDWVRVGRAVETAREGLGLTQKGLGELADGAGRTVIQTIERGHKFKKVTKTLRNVELALGWKRGSVENILAGGDALPSDELAERNSIGRSAQGAYAGLPLRVANTLAEGVTLDTTILPLTDYAAMVVVVKGKPTATPEQLRLALLAWEGERGYLRRSQSQPDGAPSTQSAPQEA
ncbi:hypothetical protein [Actinacidiphila sp. ITFR-21]|uniref:hypothetical protein n=1 Tax=Actinacidiphila sp. ITFR-21 TaxID=3075199 RepID=UPI002889D248|nr:hypothetical protein [Streptomyces sp. ITFR-21]WNI15921.1 hypothetical protein RLT57_10585 [Streptomyces sp. ITFR-21]